jgi:peptidoglycan/LPS O-acetylase OafA/YrhL
MSAVPLQASPRQPGLDTLRALAIALVFMFHYQAFVSHEATFGVVGTVGWVGVDLFFVLSGYLIGNQMFAGMARGERLSLTGFYARRALRTWPAFWVVLAAFFLWPGELGGRTPPPLWAFLTFTQNFGLQPGTAFSHAWSLCVEEQFYVVLPLAALLALRLGTGRRKAALWAALVVPVALGVVARAWLWQRYGREADGAVDGYFPHIYYATLCRFDEFMPGLALAALKNFHPSAWQRVQRQGRTLEIVGLASVAALLVGVHEFQYTEGYGYGFFMTAFGYSLIAMAFALLVAAALCPQTGLHRTTLPGARHLALWSYSIYLTHKPLAHVIQGWSQAPFKALGLPAGATLVAITLGSVALGAALYFAVERPFMALRDRRFPSIFVR